SLPGALPALPPFPARHSSDLCCWVGALPHGSSWRCCWNPPPWPCWSFGGCTYTTSATRVVDLRVSPVCLSCHSSAFTRPLTVTRSEEHTSELQSRFDLVCRLL